MSHPRTWTMDGSSAASGTTIATANVTGTDYPQVGDVVFVGVGHDNSGAAVPTLSSVAISGAGAVDSWRIKSQGTAAQSAAGGAVQADGAWGIVTTAFTSATVITATLSAAVTAKAIGVGAFVGDDIVPTSGTSGTSGTGQLAANSGLGFNFGVAATESGTALGVNTGTQLLTASGGSGGAAARVAITMVYASGQITTVAPTDGGYTYFGMKSLIAVSLSGNGIGSGEAFGDPTISGGGGGATTLSPTAIGSGETFGTPSASTPLTVSPTGISSAEGFGTPVVATPIVASPSGIASAEAFGFPTIAKTLTVSPTAIGSGQAFGTPVIPAAGMHNINPPGGTWWTTSFNDGQSGGISVANPFYTTDSGWSLTGARVYFNSEMITVLGAGNSVSVFVMGDDTGSGIINTLAQLTDGLVTVPSSAGWASVTFSSPISMTANIRYWVGYHTTGQYEAYNYSSTGTLYQATDGSNLFMGRPVAQTTWDVSEFEYRSSNYIAAPTTSNFWWGIDVIAGIPSGGTTTISPSGVTSAEAFGTASISKQLTASPIGITPPVSINSEASYNFDTSSTTFLDQTGHGHTATLVGDAAWSSSGVGGSAGAISNPIGRADGSGATIPRTGLEPTSAITVMAWVRLKENTGAWAVALSKSRAGAGDSYAIYTHHQSLGKPAFYFNTTNGEAVVPQTASGILPINTWYHLTGTYDGANGKFYIDAVLQDTVAITGSLVYDTTNLSLLTSLAFTNETIAADIDDVRILTGVALTQAEIAEARATRVGAEGQFGSPTITMGAAGITASPSAIPTAEVFGTLSVTSILTAIAQGIASGESFGTPSISATISISPVGISSAEAFGTLSVSATLTVSPTGGVSAESFGTVNVTLVLSVNPSGVPPGETFGTPVITVSGAGITVSPTGIVSAEVFGSTAKRRTKFAEAMLARSPGLLWEFDETSGTVAADSSSNNRPGTYTSSPTLGEPSLLGDGAGKSVKFTGGLTRVVRAGESWMNPATGGIALAGVVKVESLPPTLGALWSRDDASGIARHWVLYLDSTGKFRFLGTSTTASNVDSTSAAVWASAGNKYFIAMVWDYTAGNVKIYIANDGVNAVTLAHTITFGGVETSDTSRPFVVGNLDNRSDLAWYHRGWEDAVGFFPQVLTTTDLDQLATAAWASDGSVPVGIVSAEAFGTPIITQTIPVAPTAIGSGEAFGTPVITTGGGPTTVSPTGIASVEAFGTLTYSGTRTVSPVGVGSLEAFGTPVITSGGVVLSPTAISTAESFGTPSITKTLTVSPTGIAGPGGVPFTTYIKNTYSPKLEWMMDETSGTVATDSSGNAKDGTITGSPTLGAAGIINDGGTGILFDGVNGKYIVGPLENTLSLNQWTVIAFAKTSSTVEQTLAQRSGTGNGRFQIKNSWGTADGKMYVQNDENLAFVATPASVADGTGRMLAFRQDATTLKIFQNGGTQLASVASAAAGTNVQNGTLYVGANNSGLKVWNGTLDGFIVVAGALTTTQLDDIYAASQAAAASQFGTLTITQVLNVLTNGIPTDEGFGIPSVSTQLISSPTGIASTEAFGTPALSFAVTYSPIGIASAESVSSVVITAGGIVLSPTSIVSAQAIGVPSITQSTPLSPSGIPSEETFGTVVITKTLTVLPSGINSSLAFGTLTATISPDIRPTPIPSAEAFGTPVIGGGIPTTVGTAYTAGVGIEVGVYLSGHPQLIWPAPTPPVTQAALPDPTVAPTLSASDTSGGALPDGTYRYSYAAWRGTVAQCTKPSPTADISITVNDTVTLTYPTIPGADGYIVYREKIA